MTTITITLAIGFTQARRTGGADDYVPTFHGYRPGAEQRVVSIDIEPADPTNLDAEHYAEAVFEATNAPFEDVSADAKAIRVALTAAMANGALVGSLSVGDTVTLGEVMYACAEFGWNRAYPQAVSA